MSRGFIRGIFDRLRKPVDLPGVATISEFEHLFQNECARVERNGRALSLVVYTPSENDRTHRSILAQVLLSRVRPMDMVGELDAQRLAVLLPETSSQGAWVLAEDTLSLMAGRRVRAHCEVFSYPSPHDTLAGAHGHAHTTAPVSPGEHVRASSPISSFLHEESGSGNGTNNGPYPGPGSNGSVASAAEAPLPRAHPSINGFGHRSVANAALAYDASQLARGPEARAKWDARSNAQTIAVLSPHAIDSEPNAHAHPSTKRGKRYTESGVRRAPSPIALGRVEPRGPRALHAPLASHPIQAPEGMTGLRAVRAALGARPVESLAPLLVVPLPLWKRALDIAACSLMLPILSPLLLVAALLVRCTSPGPIIFRQQRAGRGGKPFTIYKFRSMFIDAEARRVALEQQNEASGPVFKIRADPRITPVGKFLRQTSIDELPQLWNVLKGDMTLVGPRPPMLSEVPGYERWQLGRLRMTSGITCIWQVSGRSEVGFADWVRMDLRYAQKRGFLTDVRLLLKTVSAVFSRRGAY
jgi:lipopolysaccharide/colanic/teichoic acid biosynthesis glycosyltransferase